MAAWTFRVRMAPPWDIDVCDDIVMALRSVAMGSCVGMDRGRIAMWGRGVGVWLDICVRNYNIDVWHF